MPKGKKNLSVDSLRHAEYYGMQSKFDNLYQRSKEGDDFTDLTPKQMKHYEEMYHDPQLFFLLGKTLCVEHTTPEGYAQFMQATRQPPRQEQER